jgi:hypothetical protein
LLTKPSCLGSTYLPLRRADPADHEPEETNACTHKADHQLRSRHHWWPQFEQSSQSAEQLIQKVRDSVDPADADSFDRAVKLVVAHTPTEASGTLSLEHGVWVVRLLSENMHLLQLACEKLVLQLVEYVNRNKKTISFVGPIQIVEQKRKETIIEGQTLATAEDRLSFARSHKSVELWIVKLGVIVLVVLLLITYPWPIRDFTSHPQTWLFSVFEKFIGSVAVTALIAYLQYRYFFAELRDHTIRWSIPGAPEKHDVRTRAA